MKGFLNWLCLLLCVGVLPPVLYGDAVLKGMIMQHNSGGNGVTGVQVIAVGERANPKITNDTGYFEMVLPGKEPGERVVLSCKKEGWEVVRVASLEVVLRKNQDADDMVKIDMWRTADKEKRIGEYTGALKAAIDKNFRELRAEIRGLTVSLAEKDKRIAQLQAERDTALTMVREQAEQMAKTDLDGMSEMYRKADGLIKAGKLEEAYNALDDDQTDLCLRDAQRKIEMCVFNYLQKARISIILLRFDKAGLYFEKALDADPGNHEIIYEYGAFLHDQNHFDKALHIYGKGFRYASSEYLKADYLNCIGVQYETLNCFTKALNAYSEALKIRRVLAKRNMDVYLSDVAMTLNNLGLLHFRSNRLTPALNAYNEALELFRTLANKNPATYSLYVAGTLNNIGCLYSKTNHFDHALEVYNIALKHYVLLANRNPEAYSRYVADTENNLGLLHAASGNLNRAVDAFDEALTIREKLAKDNPQRFDINLSTTLISLALCYINPKYKNFGVESIQKALSHLERARTIARKYPQVPKAQQIEADCTEMLDKIKKIMEK